jgi:hypothetical protein
LLARAAQLFLLLFVCFYGQSWVSMALVCLILSFLGFSPLSFSLHFGFSGACS